MLEVMWVYYVCVGVLCVCVCITCVWVCETYIRMYMCVGVWGDQSMRAYTSVPYRASVSKNFVVAITYVHIHEVAERWPNYPQEIRLPAQKVHPLIG